MACLQEAACLRGHTDRVWHVAWDPAGRTLATCGGDKTIRIWARNGAGAGAGLAQDDWVCTATLEEAQTRTIRSCEWSLCGRYLAAASFDASVAIWERDASGAEFELVATLEGHENEVKSVAYSPSGGLIATASRDKSVWLWDADVDQDFECVSVMHGHEQDVKFVSWHPNRELLFSASYDDTVRVWAEDDDDWFCVDTLRGHTSTVWGISHSASGQRLVSCSDDCSLIVWQHFPGEGHEREGCWRNACTLSGFHSRTVFSVDWSKAAHGVIASAGADNSIKLFREAADGSTTDAPSFELAGSAEDAHRGDVNCVRWHPKESTLLASAGDDGAVRLWRFTDENA